MKVMMTSELCSDESFLRGKWYEAKPTNKKGGINFPGKFKNRKIWKVIDEKGKERLLNEAWFIDLKDLEEYSEEKYEITELRCEI